MAEAIAIRRALVPAREYGFSQVILASDCLSMIQRLISEVRDRSSVGSVVSDIKQLATEFSSVSFKHYGRKQNVPAHVLARRREQDSCNISFSVAPECIRQELCNDVK
jgi:hypothetical protein